MNIIRFENGKMVEAWEDYGEYGMKPQLGMELKPKEVKKEEVFKQHRKNRSYVKARA